MNTSSEDRHPPPSKRADERCSGSRRDRERAEEEDPGVEKLANE